MLSILNRCPMSTHLFSGHVLPKNEDLYQFCYVTGENELYGASIPFSFSTVNTPRPRVEPINIQPSVDHRRNVSCCSTDSDFSESSEMVKLREENHLLRECMKLLLSDKGEKSDMCNKHLELRQEMNKLKLACVPVVQVQHELALLKQQFFDIERGYRSLCLKMENMLSQDRSKDPKSNDNVVRTTDISSVSRSTDFRIDDLGTIPPFPFPQ